MTSTSKQADDPFDPFSLQGEQSPFNTQSSSVRPAEKQPKQEDLFDPFGIETSPIHEPPQITRLTRSNKSSASTVASNASSTLTRSTAKALPPKLRVKFTVHEEVSSIAKVGSENYGSSDISVEGTVQAQVQSSDAHKNVPFALVGHGEGANKIQFFPNETYVVTTPAVRQMDQVAHMVQIPKAQLASVTVGNYAYSETVVHMPILLERKVTFKHDFVRIAIQVRSKLTNNGDMKDFTVAVAIPEHINGGSIEVLRGDGEWDSLKRVIKWKLPSLPKGESFMVSAQAKLWTPIPIPGKSNEEGFPVLLRCSSDFDQISTVEFRATDVDGYKATVIFTKVQTFRLLHRLT